MTRACTLPAKTDLVVKPKGTGTHKLGANCRGIISLESVGTPDSIDFLVTGTPDDPSILLMLSNRADRANAGGVMERMDI